MMSVGEREDSELLGDGVETARISISAGRALDAVSPAELLDDLIDDIGTSRLQWQWLFILGLCNAADAVEVLAIGFIITVFKDPVSHKGINELSFWSSLLTSSVFVGMLIGGLISGSLGDRFGRKPLLTMSLFVNALSAFVSVLTPLLPDHMQLGWLVFFRFIGGIGVGGSVPSAFALGSEIGISNTRSLFINIIACFWQVGSLYTSFCAFIVLGRASNGNKWAFFAALVAVPATVATYLCVFHLGESARFLLTRGRLNEIRQILLGCLESRRNSFSLVEYNVLQERVENLCNSSFETPEVPNVDSKQRFRELLRPPHLRTTVLVCGIFTFLSFSNYGINSWITELFKKVKFNDAYLTSLFYTFASIPGLAIAISVVDRAGRRAVTACAMVCACVFAIIFSFNTSSRWLVLFSAAGFNASCAAAWNGLDIFSAELFQSRLRGTGLGIGAACGRIGSIFANIFNSSTLAKDGTGANAVSQVLFVAGCSMILGAFCAFLLPETKGRRHLG
mmetsp:Transcript_14059/g.24938  ORF Transcript_14059/g.24938 Transcript_14059/m.24938 type:complete len:508 (-) Transcript_14059:3012-4535(-)